MKLSQVVKYYNLLHSKSLDSDYATLLHAVESTVLTIANQPIQVHHLTKELQTGLEQIQSSVTGFALTVEKLKQELQLMIREHEVKMYDITTERYSREQYWENLEYLQTRKISATNESKELLRNKIRLHSDWRAPGMILRPGLENFVEDMVPLDPLYLVDRHQELLDPAINNFTPEYRRRLRSYCITDSDPAVPIFGQLPQNQFGFIFAYNYFNYRPVEIIDRYIEEFYTLLRPGGTVIFTYNECDVAHGVSLAETFMSYTPGHRIQAAIEKTNFEIVKNQVGPYDVAWFELRKPGTITSLRGGQTLAEIIPN